MALRNIKMCSLKPRWVILENADIQIGLSYDTSSSELATCQIHIGNKSSKVVESIELKYETEEQLLVGKEIRPNSFIETEKISYTSAFEYLRASYNLKDQQQRSEHVILPFNWTKFGDFEICTYEQFAKAWKSRSGEAESEKYCFDTEVVGRLGDYRKYFPNLVESGDGAALVGIFSIERGEYRGMRLCCRFEDHLDTHRIVVGKTGNTEEIREKFLSDLEFIFRI